MAFWRGEVELNESFFEFCAKFKGGNVLIENIKRKMMF